MQFYSFEFIVFVPIVFFTYWLLKGKRAKNVFLIAASSWFLSTSDIRFFLLLLAVSSLAYISGNYLIAHKKYRRTIVTLNVIIFLSVLALFKYLNFFIDNFYTVLTHLGFTIDKFTVHLILPLGLSFYIFMAISYVIDCYNNKITPKPSVDEFFAYITFFPHILAGPIDRGRLMIPQLHVDRQFNYEEACDAMRQILWGLFKKSAIADVCDEVVSVVWSDMASQSSLSFIIAAFLYSIQIYCDFSGYSDMAIGIGRLFGIRMMKNFDYPYFARNVSEFWRRWHISLTSWFTEYVYIPLGGNRNGKTRTILNTLVVFILCGFWHGANFTFILWGGICGVMFIPYLLQKNARKYKTEPIEANVQTFVKIFVNFAWITFAWIFFRSDSLDTALSFIENTFTSNNPFAITKRMKYAILLSLVMIFVEWCNRNENYGFKNIKKYNIVIRYIIYFMCLFFIFLFSKTNGNFIYQNF